MDGTKTIRRRTHDYEFNENSQFKRKFPNGTYGESRLVENIQNNNNNNNSSGRRFLSSPQNGHSKEKLPNCTIGRTTAAEIHSSLPSLPPSLRESERMLHVQRWINSIPPDLPSWIQVSHNKIIPVTNPHESYAEVEDSIISEIPDTSDLASNHDILDCNPGCNLNSVNQTMDYYSKQPNNHSSNPSTQNHYLKFLAFQLLLLYNHLRFHRYHHRLCHLRHIHNHLFHFNCIHLFNMGIAVIIIIITLL
ncbi:unnamed protein product [Schistosoma mattheei]|uniref:Uncharacterized protein n=1 Tax=Schistosoma mattheei TaxID=31246 RepID=A0AA85BSQ0_9TREM|nr:unnamed protein product [Schistosoma mattheei]